MKIGFLCPSVFRTVRKAKELDWIAASMLPFARAASPPEFVPRAWYNDVMKVIAKNRDTLGGTPVFLGTRVPIQALVDYLEGGETLEDFLEGFPTVSRESAVAALEEAKQLLLARP
jgi:uncharacterized protein (DUF433 family)